MKNNELIEAISLLEIEKKISKHALFEAIDAALVSAYKKNFGANHDCTVSINRETGAIRVYSQKLVVDEVNNPLTEISIDAARLHKPVCRVGDMIELDATPANFGRIAAMTAKQIIVQRIREAERSNVFTEYSDKENELLFGTIQKIDKKGVVLEISGVEAVLPPNEQVEGEEYTFNQHLRVYVCEVKRNQKGPQIVVSRTHPGLVKKLFEREVPEIMEGTVEIKAIAREAGSRTKLSVYSNDPNVDPIGACVGHKGVRIASVLSEIGSEKIDVIKYNDDVARYVAESLSPATVISVDVNDDLKIATATVGQSQLSLAIGKEGQNVRLAARLTGWKIDIKPAADVPTHTPDPTVGGDSADE